MRRPINIFLINTFLLLEVFAFCSCGSSINEKAQGKEKAPKVIENAPSIVPIQRTVYNVQLGCTYTYEELLLVLQKSIDNLVSEKDYDASSYKPRLSVSKQNNYLSYFIFSSSKSSQQYLFGNQYWDSFSCLSTLDGTIFSINFSSEGKEFQNYEALYEKIMSVLIDKYGKPSFVNIENGNYCYWYDDNTQIDLQCSYSGNLCSVDLGYTDLTIVTEVTNQQKTQGFNEL